ncbi:MAG: hypothetical protein CL609_22480 [Anaerolineaceae bacterium]|nr:hypothetical protein [Anaerolineaceae bacterium]
MNLSDWHQRFLQQAQWSKSARNFFLTKINIPPQPSILEVGCGTGAVLSEFKESGLLFGIDLDFLSVDYAKKSNEGFHLTNTNGYQLPFPDQSFDLTYCHYLFLWLSHPEEMIKEMQRVTRPGGWVCLFAEPDYAARLDSPQPLDQLGLTQNQALKTQGVQLTTGRNLTRWLAEAGLKNIQSGILGGFWDSKFDQDNWQLEWLTIRHDLDNLLTDEALLTYQKIDQEAYQQEQRVLFIPTFYAWGKKEN